MGQDLTTQQQKPGTPIGDQRPAGGGSDDYRSGDNGPGGGKRGPRLPVALNISKQISQKDAAMLSRAVQLEETDPPAATRGVVRLVAVFIVVFVLWAHYTPFAEKVQAPGAIVPLEQVQPVASLNGGRVRTVRVADGDSVSAGDILIELDRTAEQAELSRILADLKPLTVEERWLDSQISGTPATYSDFTLADKGVISRALDRLDSRADVFASTQAVLTAQLQAAQASSLGLQAEIAALKDQVAALAETLSRREQLAQSGSGSQIAALQAREVYSERSAELARRQTVLAEAEASIAEVRGMISVAEDERTEAARTRLSEITAEQRRLNARGVALERDISDGMIRAPIDGIISGMQINLPGRVVDPGALLLTLVPQDGQLLAEVRISPKDIGQISTGQPALIRVEGYRFGRVGGVSGLVERISADPYAPDGETRFFRAWIRLDQNYVGTDPQANRIISGMDIAADIQTGEKSLLTYLIRPVSQSLDTAFSER